MTATSTIKTLTQAMKDGHTLSSHQFKALSNARFTKGSGCQPELNMTTDRKETQNANRAYDVTHNELLEQIALLQKNLEAHNRQQAKDRGNWDYSGDLTSIRNSLVEINSRFTK